MANLKYYNTATGLWEEIKVSTKFKELLNTEVLTQDQNYANIGVTSYNPNEDVIFSICNSTWLQKDKDYVVNGGLLRIESKDGSNWKNRDTFNFVVLKNVDKEAVPTADGSLIQDGSITIAKLATSIQTYINKIGVTDISIVGATLSDAINALNTQLSDIMQKLDGSLETINALLNGWTGAGSRSKTGKICIISIDASGGLTAGGTLIYKLDLNNANDIKYKPLKKESTIVFCQNGSYTPGSGLVSISPTGELSLFLPSGYNQQLNIKIVYESEV